jgi:hypothetical protein
MAKHPFNQERIAYAKQHKIAERQLLPMFRKALAQSIQPVINWANTFGLDGLNPDILINRNVWSLTYQKAFNDIGSKFARREYYFQRKQEGLLDEEEKAWGIGFLIDVWIGKLKEFAASYAAEIAPELNSTTIEIIRRALGEAGELEIDSLGRVRWFIKTLKNYMKTRSLTISRTEATRTSNLGKELGARSWIDEQGGGGYKMWLGREDERERESHNRVNNVIIPIDDFYEVGGHPALRPGDTTLPASQVISCRCSQSLMSPGRYRQLEKRGRIVNGRVI